MLVTSIFSFFHNVFKKLLSQGHQKSGLYGKELRYIYIFFFKILKYNNLWLSLYLETQRLNFYIYLLFTTCFWLLTTLRKKAVKIILRKGESTGIQHLLFLLTTFSALNPLLHKYSFWCINNRQLLKTLWEKKKLLIMSNSFFSHNVFYSIR